MIRLLLVAPPFSGHLNPLIAIARRLRERGFDPRFVTGPARVPLLRELGFHADPILADDPDALERVADPPRPVRSNPVKMAGQLRQSLAVLAVARGEIERIVARDQPALLLPDRAGVLRPLFADFARGAVLGVPGVADFRLVQEAPDRFRLAVRPVERFADVVAALRRWIGGSGLVEPTIVAGEFEDFRPDVKLRRVRRAFPAGPGSSVPSP